MTNEELILKLNELVRNIKYEKNISENGKNKSLKQSAKDELLRLSDETKSIFKENNLLKIKLPHLKEEDYDQWYSDMGMGDGLIHDINMVVFELKKIRNDENQQ